MLDNAESDLVSGLLQSVRKAIRSDRSYLTDPKGDSTLSRLQESLDAITFVSERQLASHEENIAFRSSQSIPSGTGFLFDHLSVRAQVRQQMQLNPPHFTWDVSSAIEFKSRAFYLDEHGSLFVPTALLTRDVFYGENASRFLNHGTLGAIVVRELAKIFAPGSTNHPEDPWTPEATNLYVSHMSCYVAFQGYGAGLWSFNKSSAEFQRELFLWLTSARVAYAALKDDFAASSHRSADWKSVQKGFFLRFCLAACDSWSKTSLSSRQKCLWPMFDMPEFADAFECPPRSYMASQHRCRA
ncbi:hypothetical protein V5799_000951 [Amblyomma americanum]|uniref:Peptidase M13 C-terminal domain-containing protein n=1 Tax=Amblyomma americanum TaxID=6943 RepID=A0AAQ4D1K8_AMBAM